MDKLPKCPANFVPLSPITFLQRAASVYSDRPSVMYGRVRFTWKQTYDRCRRLASALRSLLNVSRNDVVSVLAPNIPALYEMHFAVPMAGAVLNAINTRLDSRNVATILAHSEAKVFFVDYQYARLAGEALKHLVANNVALPLVVMIHDLDTPTGVRLGELECKTLAGEALKHLIANNVALPLVVIDDLDAPAGARHGELEYESLVAAGNPAHEPCHPKDEWDPVALNYTSGTTAAPKGVVYSHRGAYLSTLSLLLQWGVGNEPVYLWSLPMFHCNGWTFTWGMAARGGTNVCIRTTSAPEMYNAMAEHKVTHMCCAPIVFNILLGADPTDYRRLSTRVEVLTGGAPPPASLLEKVENLGFHVTHAYGMTEATGPALVCEWQAEWNNRSRAEKARLKARQGISVLTLSDVDVVRCAKTMASVPRDGRTMGEIVLKGSSIMKGYFKNEKDTQGSFKNGWFLTGDVGVIHPDGYLEIKDRSKDVIISGGENISSVEVEDVLYKHPMVAEAAVVAMPHHHWGETPCAFVALTKEVDVESVKEEEIIEFCRENMSRFMVPKKVVFVKELPRNSNGKVMKNVLRERAKGFKTVSEQRKKVNGNSGDNNGNGNNGRKDVNNLERQVLAFSRL